MTTSRLAARKTCGAPSSAKSSAARAFESLALSLVFDIDWSELLVITIAAIVVVGLGPDANHGPPANANFADYCGWRSLPSRSGTLSCAVTNSHWTTLVLPRWATQKRRRQPKPTLMKGLQMQRRILERTEEIRGRACRCA